MGWWNRAKDAAKKAAEDIRKAAEKAARDAKAEADRLAARAKKEAEKMYPYCLKYRPVSQHFLTDQTKRNLLEKKKRYLGLSLKVMNPNQTYHNLNHCDGLLFDALSSVGGAPVNIPQYFKTGRWVRAVDYDCMVHSNSTISRDMIVGMCVWASFFKEKDIFKKTITKMKSSNWIAGDSTSIEDKFGRTFMTPQIRTMMSHVMTHVGLGKMSEYHELPHLFPKVKRGFERHLQSLSIVVYSICGGKISLAMLNTIKMNAKDQYRNALWQYLYAKYVTGNYEPCISLLNTQSLWPERRLPTRADRKPKWLFERDQSEYITTKETTKYSGMDFCFLVSLIERDFNW